MYRYDEFDQAFVTERVAQFRGQVERRLSGEITEDQFKPLRLMNGVYLQLHAYMLRIAIPYGSLASDQLRMLAGDDAAFFPQNGDGIAGRLADAAARVFARSHGPLVIVWPGLPRLR